MEKDDRPTAPMRPIARAAAAHDRPIRLDARERELLLRTINIARQEGDDDPLWPQIVEKLWLEGAP